MAARGCVSFAVEPAAVDAPPIGAPPTREAAFEILSSLAAGLRDHDEGAALSRLLERIAARADCEALRAALVEAGALAMLRAAPGGWRPPR